MKSGVRSGRRWTRRSSKCACSSAASRCRRSSRTASHEADEQIFASVRESLGLDQAVTVNSGAAPIAVEVLEFFHAHRDRPRRALGDVRVDGARHGQPARGGKIGTVGPPAPASS